MIVLRLLSFLRDARYELLLRESLITSALILTLLLGHGFANSSERIHEDED